MHKTGQIPEWGYGSSPSESHEVFMAALATVDKMREQPWEDIEKVLEGLHIVAASWDSRWN